MSNTSIRWFDAFMGLGYNFYDVRPKIILIFDKKNTLFKAWGKVIKWWPDDEIRMRFIETDHSYEFILYSRSRILDIIWVFFKSLKVSEHYTEFKKDYNGAAILRLALYRPKHNSYELELFDYNKRISDVQFLKEPVSEQEDIVFRTSKMLRRSSTT